MPNHDGLPPRNANLPRSVVATEYGTQNLVEETLEVLPIRRHDSDTDSDSNEHLDAKRLRIGWGGGEQNEEGALVIYPHEIGPEGANDELGRWWSQEQWLEWGREQGNMLVVGDGNEMSENGEEEDEMEANEEPRVQCIEEPKIVNTQAQGNSGDEIQPLISHQQNLGAIQGMQMDQMQFLKKEEEKLRVGNLLEAGQIKEAIQGVSKELQDTQNFCLKNVEEFQGVQTNLEEWSQALETKCQSQIMMFVQEFKECTTPEIATLKGQLNAIVGWTQRKEEQMNALVTEIEKLKEESRNWAMESQQEKPEIVALQGRLDAIIGWTQQKEEQMNFVLGENERLKEMFHKLALEMQQEKKFRALAIAGLSRTQETTEKKIQEEVERVAQDLSEEVGQGKQKLEVWQKLVEQEIVGGARKLNEVENHQRRLAEGICQGFAKVEGIMEPTLNKVIEGMQTLHVDVETVKAKQQVANPPTPVVVVTPTLPMQLPMPNLVMATSSPPIVAEKEKLAPRLREIELPVHLQIPFDGTPPTLKGCPSVTKGGGVKGRGVPKDHALCEATSSSSLVSKGKGIVVKGGGKGGAGKGVKGKSLGRGMALNVQSSEKPWSNPGEKSKWDAEKVWPDEPARKVNVVGFKGGHPTSKLGKGSSSAFSDEASSEDDSVVSLWGVSSGEG